MSMYAPGRLGQRVLAVCLLLLHRPFSRMAARLPAGAHGRGPHRLQGGRYQHQPAVRAGAMCVLCCLVARIGCMYYLQTPLGLGTRVAMSPCDAPARHEYARVPPLFHFQDSLVRGVIGAAEADIGDTPAPPALAALAAAPDYEQLVRGLLFVVLMWRERVLCIKCQLPGHRSPPHAKQQAHVAAPAPAPAGRRRARGAGCGARRGRAPASRLRPSSRRSRFQQGPGRRGAACRVPCRQRVRRARASGGAHQRRRHARCTTHARARG